MTAKTLTRLSSEDLALLLIHALPEDASQEAFNAVITLQVRAEQGKRLLEEMKAAVSAATYLDLPEEGAA